MRSFTAAPIRRAKTTATSRACRPCWRGCPSDVPGTTINRLCGSGMDAVITAARGIKAGEIDIVIAGGVEMHVARALRDAEGGQRLFTPCGNSTIPPSAGAS